SPGCSCVSYRRASTRPIHRTQPVYLDWAARETPSIALAGAAREALRMVDVFEAMLRGALDSLNRGDRKRVTETARMDNVLDRLARADSTVRSSHQSRV